MTDRDAPYAASPRTIPIFPLPGALLLPQGQLPLNVFEPRYLNMVDDVLGGARLIGMVQPAGNTGALYPIGCAGRITSFHETDDGRYLITLTGVNRFRMEDELSAATPYRQAHVDWSPFKGDYRQNDVLTTACRDELIEALRPYLETQSLHAEWECVENAPCEKLVNSLAMICPFSPEEKQALLEAATVEDRASVLIALMEMATAEANCGGEQKLQ